MKDCVYEDICLVYFKPNAKTVIQVDSSVVGQGAALINDVEAVAFASKSLTNAESRCANIDRELLAMVFGYKKCKLICIWERILN